MIEALYYGFMQRALLAGILIAIIAGLIGIFIVLRRMSPIGDGLAHVAFGGIAVGMFAGVYPIIVALVFSIVSVLGIQYLQTKKIYGEIGISVFYAAGLALGIIVLSYIKGFTVDLFSYLFGNILSITSHDIFVIATISIIVISFILYFKRELFYISFDQDSARVSGINVTLINILFSILVAITVVISLQMMGILLVSALLVIPAAIALQLGKGMNATILSSVIISSMAVILGIVLSFYLDIATSGAIILLLVIGFFAVAFRR